MPAQRLSKGQAIKEPLDLSHGLLLPSLRRDGLPASYEADGSPSISKIALFGHTKSVLYP
jgi:hypothetical protein